MFQASSGGLSYRKSYSAFIPFGAKHLSINLELTTTWQAAACRFLHVSFCKDFGKGAQQSVEQAPMFFELAPNTFFNGTWS